MNAIQRTWLLTLLAGRLGFWRGEAQRLRLEARMAARGLMTSGSLSNQLAEAYERDAKTCAEVIRWLEEQNNTRQSLGPYPGRLPNQDSSTNKGV